MNEEQKPLLQTHTENTVSIKKEENSFWDLLKFTLIALLIIVPLRLFIAQPFIVSGESMYPTFKNKDYLIVDQLTYRIHPPNRGDVVIFHPPAQTKGIYYIKRVIGLPGETVSMKDNIITVVNEENPEGFVLNEPYIKNVGGSGFTQTLKEGEYYTLGDNRPRSADSRSWGVLPEQNIVGRALLRLFPFSSVAFLPGAQAHYEQE